MRFFKYLFTREMRLSEEEKPTRGFESHPFRHKINDLPNRT